MLEKQILFFFSDRLRNNTYEMVRSYWLSYFNLSSSQNVGLARRKQNGGDGGDFSKDVFSAVLVKALRNFHYVSLKVEQIKCLQLVIV